MGKCTGPITQRSVDRKYYPSSATIVNIRNVLLGSAVSREPSVEWTPCCINPNPNQPYERACLRHLTADLDTSEESAGNLLESKGAYH